ncbi:MAG: class D sortase [Oscillospiraceae bacterium]|nr:class D sortase [Oscillospiraceae bacterium]
MSQIKTKIYLLKFIIVPIAFFVVGTVILMFALLPIFKPYIEVAKLFVFSEDYVSRTSQNTVDVSCLSDNDYINIDNIDLPAQGDRYATINIDSIELETSVYYGDSVKELNKGVGTYLGCYLPGQGRTILMCAHNNSYFKDLNNISEGDHINISTNYGKYIYTVTGFKVADKSDKSAYDLTRKSDNLILYTCYPFDTLGLTRMRYFVYADYTSGPRINYQS